MSNANEPAFAAPAEWHPLHEMQIGGSAGLTKRELFAAMAMQGLLSSWPAEDRFDATRVTTFAVGCADALLAALEESK